LVPDQELAVSAVGYKQGRYAVYVVNSVVNVHRACLNDKIRANVLITLLKMTDVDEALGNREREALGNRVVPQETGGTHLRREIICTASYSAHSAFSAFGKYV
jgi:hypothetical protein